MDEIKVQKGQKWNPSRFPQITNCKLHLRVYLCAPDISHLLRYLCYVFFREINKLRQDNQPLQLFVETNTYCLLITKDT
jgi:hypothetical protein